MSVDVVIKKDSIANTTARARNVEILPTDMCTAALVWVKRSQAFRKLIKVLLHRPYDMTPHPSLGDPIEFGFSGSTISRLITLAGLVYTSVLAATLLVDTFDIFNPSPNSVNETLKTFDVVYCISLFLLLFSAFLAIFGVIFYRAYLTVPFIISGLFAFSVLNILLNYSFFRPMERIYSTFTTFYPEPKLNALWDIIMLGTAVYLALINIREQVLYDLPPARHQSIKN